MWWRWRRWRQRGVGKFGRLDVANYDNERELKIQYGVRSQSTVIVFKGSKETTRLGGETDAAKLRAALQTAQ